MSEESSITKAFNSLGDPRVAPFVAGTVALFTGAAASASSGHPVEGLFTAVGVAMLPDLIKSIPAQRHADRVDAALKDLQGQIHRLNVQVDSWSDDQFEFITNTLNSMLSAVNPQKLEILKRIALNASQNNELVSDSGAFLSRIIRDITAPEIIYLVRNFGKQPCILTAGLDEKEKNDMISTLNMEKTVLVLNESDKEIIVGLRTNGLLRDGIDTHSSLHLDWTRAAVKVLALVQDADEQPNGSRSTGKA